MISCEFCKEHVWVAASSKIRKVLKGISNLNLFRSSRPRLFFNEGVLTFRKIHKKASAHLFLIKKDPKKVLSLNFAKFKNTCVRLLLLIWVSRFKLDISLGKSLKHSSDQNIIYINIKLNFIAFLKRHYPLWLINYVVLENCKKTFCNAVSWEKIMSYDMVTRI